MTTVQVRDNGGLEQGSSNGMKRCWILKTFWEVESTAFSDDLMWK